ncbi:hypothetical protein CC86DRAFT_419507 [Ophiobolus disseminans]|uniref:Uncharacterized protein n=1 Tax=Ophiobolus disseminans TaxID=1469910 RepID=A0A6A6ZY56_9PLEO|nr:hypothetical protein CC86DRAFT_419507 [Ophiobolus disseminans]
MTDQSLLSAISSSQSMRPQQSSDSSPRLDRPEFVDGNSPLGRILRSEKKYYPDAEIETQGRDIRTSQAFMGATCEGSPADEALRSTLARQMQPSPPPQHNRSSSWLGRMLSRSSPAATSRSSLKSATPNESKTYYAHSSSSGVAFSDDSDDYGDFVAQARNGLASSTSHQAASLLSLGAASMRDSVNEGAATPSTASLQSLPSQSSDADVSVVQDDQSVDFQPMALWSPSPSSTVPDDTPLLSRQDLALSTPITVIDREPQKPEQDLGLSDIATIIAKEPIARVNPKGLSFAAANAILYSCTTFAAVLFILVNIANDFRCGALASEMGIAFVIGLVMCAIVHILSGANLLDLPHGMAYNGGKH